MRSKWTYFWDQIGTTYWFIPGAMVLSAISLAVAMVNLDSDMDPPSAHEQFAWLYTGGPEGAREVVSAIAGGMVTIASVTFSIVIVALTVATQQFGPRLLRNFMSDNGNKVALGTFTGLFVYCVLVQRAIRGPNDDAAVPQYSVTLAVVFGVAALGVLIYFIHHIASALHVSHLIGLVSQDLEESIERSYPGQMGVTRAQLEEEGRPVYERPWREEKERPFFASESGYLQSIDEAGLLHAAEKHHVVIRLYVRPGSYMVRGAIIAGIIPSDRMNSALSEKLASIFVLGSERTTFQDVELAVEQLAEVAVRALSTGVNDPFTAIRCVDRLASAFSHVAEHGMPAEERFDRKGHLRIVAKRVSFSGMMNAGFDLIRQYARTDVPVMVRLLESISTIAERVREEEDRVTLRNQAVMIMRAGREAFPEESDQKDLERRYVDVLEKLGAAESLEG